MKKTYRWGSCSDHPNYDCEERPKVLCERCWELWFGYLKYSREAAYWDRVGEIGR